MKWATLCYVRRVYEGRIQTLMLHRVKRQGDMHQGKWNGLGGKFLPGETPEACVIREVEEESGLRLSHPELRGLLTFPQFRNGEDWYAFVFVAHDFTGELIDSNEGVLAWIDNERLLDLNLWPGDRVFIPWLDEHGFFSARFDYTEGEYVGHEMVRYGTHEDNRAPGQTPVSQPSTSQSSTFHSSKSHAVGIQSSGGAPSVGQTAPDDEQCWLCGGETYKHHCKITCTVCGFRRDCSDP